MDLLAELDPLANIAQSSEQVKSIEDAVERWRDLFNYGPGEAEAYISEQRSNMNVGLISEDLWDIAQASGEAAGHDRESYTHFLRTCRRGPHSISNRSTVESDEQYLLKLGGQIKTAAQLQQIARLDRLPDARNGVSTEDEHTIAYFCMVNTSAKQKITEWCAKQKLPRPDFILVSIAPKALSEHSMAPMLGFDATLPQHRMSNDRSIPKPQQNEYPVWYFFYGTLQDPDKLRSIFNGTDDDQYDLRPARISGGRIKEWGNKYKALVDAPAARYGPSFGGSVDGSAFLVKSKDHEYALRLYETRAYEVVRCVISFHDGSIAAGCTFRFRER